LEILRTEKRVGLLESYSSLLALETSDPLGEKSANVEKYQNGNFWIRGVISEDETRIEDVVTLRVYDSRYPSEVIYEVDKLSTSTTFSPRWLIKEEDIIAEGVSKYGQSYKTDYDNGKRYYYRVAVVAYDRSGNQSSGLPTVPEKIRVSSVCGKKPTNPGEFLIRL